MRVATSSAVFALASLATMAAGGALAQTTTPPTSDSTQTPSQSTAAQQPAVEEIVVTGSRIARRDYVSNSPIATVGQQAIASVPSPTLETALDAMPQISISAGSGTNTVTNNGQATLDLRGLGSNRALVLLDGQRMQPSQANGSVDLNTIPPSLIDSIEIVTGGESALYGSDAIAGVVNLKLRQHVNGIEIDERYGQTTRGDGATNDVAVLGGGDFADNKGNAFLAFDYSTRDAAPYANRPYLLNQAFVLNLPTMAVNVVGANLPSQAAVNNVFSQYGISPGTVPNSRQFFVNPDGSLFVEQGALNYRGPLNTANPPIRIYNNEVQYAASNQMNAQDPLTRYNFVAHLDYELSPNVSAFMQGIFTSYTSTETSVPANTGSTTGQPQVMPVTNPFIPHDLQTLLASRPNPTAPITVTGFIDPLGERSEKDAYDVYQISGGLKGSSSFLSSSWTVFANYGETKYDETIRGYPSESAINTLLSAPGGGNGICTGGFNPFGFAPVSTSCLNYISRTLNNEQTLQDGTIEGDFSGNIIALPAGELKFALGADYRTSSYSYQPDALISIHDIANYLPVQASEGSENVAEGYGELLVPVLRDRPFIKSLDIDLSYRFSDYNISGGASTYSLNGDWAIADGLRFRGSFAHAIRAPSVAEFFTAETGGAATIGAPGVIGQGDPCDSRGAYVAPSNPNAAAVRALCVAQGVPSSLISTFQNINPGAVTTTVGNPNLKPEAADTYTFGVVIKSPLSNPILSGIQASIDYYNIDIKDAIGLVTGNVDLFNCFNPAINPTLTNANPYCQQITRLPSSGQITNINTPEFNLASYKTSGIDFELNWKIGLDAVGLDSKWGTVSFEGIASYLQTFEIQNLPGAPTLSYAGTIGNTQIDPFSDAHPTWKAKATIGWQVWDLQTDFHWRFIGGMKSASNVGNTGTTPGVSPISYFDWDATWHMSKKLDLSAGVYNLLDPTPPVVNRSLAGGLATDPNTYDLIGRQFFLGIKAKF